MVGITGTDAERVDRLKTKQPEVYYWQPLLIGAVFGLGAFATWRPPWVNPVDVACYVTAMVLAVRAFWRDDYYPRFLVAVLLASAAIPALFWTANLPATSGAVLRLFALPVIVAVARDRWHAPAFALGVTAALLIQALPLPVVLFTERHGGLARYTSILGMVGFGGYAAIAGLGVRPRWLVIPGLVIAVVTLAVAGARAPVAAAGIHAALVARRAALPYLAGAVVLLVVLLALSGQEGRRFLAGSLVPGVAIRIRTVTGEQCDAARSAYGPDYECGRGRLVWYGTGLSSYLDENPWPRPHNVYVLLVYELGVFAMIPFGLFVYAVRRGWLSWPMALSLAIYGLLDDSLVQPEGYYVLAIAFTMHAGRVGRPSWWPWQRRRYSWKPRSAWLRSP